MPPNYSFLILSFCIIFCLNSCQSSQTRSNEIKKTFRTSVIPFINKQKLKDESLGVILASVAITTLGFSQNFRYVDEEFEKYYIYNSLQLAQSIGDVEFEKLVKDIISIHEKENPGIDTYISGYYFQRDKKVFVSVKIIQRNKIKSEFQVEAKENSVELIQNLSEKILTTLEPENKEGFDKLTSGFELTRNYEALKLYLEGKEEKRKKTIYGYMNAIRKFKASQMKDGLYILPLNEIIHTLTQISSDLLELTKQEKIINNSKVISDANSQIRRNVEILQTSISIYENAKKERPDEYKQIQTIYENSPYKKQYELKASLFKNQMELLLLRWEEEKFNTESIIKGQIKRTNSGYTPLLVTEFFQTLTDSRINMNDILRSLIQYSKDHPDSRYYIHYFKNFTRLMKTMNKFDYMKLNPETNFSYHQLHQEYIFYVREYLDVMRNGL
ncbi:MAG: hypothetical protein KBA66_06800 [Leptospiraceae bacterium]|nr:hypothetical protein [Leptospiraceae bacterium]